MATYPTLKFYKNREADLNLILQSVLKFPVAKVVVEPPSKELKPEKSTPLVLEGESKCQNFLSSIQDFQLAGLLWTSNLYRASNLYGEDTIAAIGNFFGSLESTESISAWCGNSAQFLSSILSHTSGSPMALPSPISALPCIPLISAAGAIAAMKCVVAADLQIIAMSTTVEISRSSLQFLEIASASLHVDLARVANDARWLLDESKVAPRASLLDSSDAILKETLSVITTLRAAATLARTACRNELKSTMKLEGSRFPLVASPMQLLFGSRKFLFSAALDAAESCLARIESILVPICVEKALATRGRILKEWPQDTPMPSEVRKPLRSEPLLDVTREGLTELVLELRSKVLKLKDANPFEEALRQAAQLVVVLGSIELKLGCLLIENDEVDCFNDAVIKASKKKKNISSKVHIGQPLSQCLNECYSLLSSETAIVPQPPADTIERLSDSYTLFSLADTFTKYLTPLNQGGRRPKVAKGTIDTTSQQMIIREQIFDLIKQTFRKYGAVAIDTPIFERKETLMGKYGEDQKLIFDLKDQGGEQLSLRYDLTVPFARFLATHNIEKVKRLHVGKVYRRDEPQMNRGRFREFYQCDFDIAGEYESMVPDAEVLCALVDILKALRGAIGPFIVKLNHRGLLDGIMEVAGVPVSSFRPICSAIDKLDKLNWSEVQEEMCVTKGLMVDSALKIKSFVEMSGTPKELLDQLDSMEDLMKIEAAKLSLKQLRVLYEYLDAAGVSEFIRFDLSLARGLDYYTGVIFEATLTGQSVVGSIAAGGRYDKLVGMFGNRDIPSVGVSIGVERVFRIIEKNLGMFEDGNEADSPTANKKTSLKESTSNKVQLSDHLLDVYVCSVGDNMLRDRIRVANLLRENGIATDFTYAKNPKLGKQLSHASDQGIPLAIVFGQTEIDNSVMNIKIFAYGKDEASSSEEIQVPLSNVVASVKKLLSEGKTQNLRAAEVIFSRTIA